MTIRKLIVLASITAVLSIALVAVPNGSLVGAISASDWRAGRIIDDVVFFNKNAMSVSQIQNFLSSKVPVCDTNGTQLTSRWNSAAGRYYTRAEWGAQVGNPAPFTCLKDYRENPSTHQSNYSNPSANIPGSISAAQIIYNAAQQYNINPQVFLVMLQKEQGLITDDWPYQRQYTYAMGANCPDTPSGCDPAYSGFATQVNRAGYLYNYYKNNINQFNFNVGNNYILWNVTSSGCGGSGVYIENIATAMLYIYTPYQPNTASLNAFPGQGDGCSSYGNRNFWFYFNNWFGSTLRTNGNIVLASGISINKPGGVVFVGDTITASYTVKNNADYIAFAGQLGICARINDKWYDFGFESAYFGPQETKTISYSKKLSDTGILKIYVCSYHPVLGWASGYYPYSNDNLTRQLWTTSYENPMITTGITVSPERPTVGQTITAGLTIRNNSNNYVNLGSIVVAGRNQWGGNVDFTPTNDVVIAPNSTFTYLKNRVVSAPGKHTFFIAQWNGVWSTSYPKSVSGVVRQNVIDVLDNPVITSGLSLGAVSASIGQQVTASFTLRNTSTNAINIGSMVVAVRSQNGINYDFPLINDVVVPPGGNYVYSKSRAFGASGTYQLYIANWKGVWSTSLPLALDSSINRSINLTIN